MDLHHCPEKRKNWGLARSFAFVHDHTASESWGTSNCILDSKFKNSYLLFQVKYIFLLLWNTFKLIKICKGWKTIVGRTNLMQKTQDTDYLQKYFFFLRVVFTCEEYLHGFHCSGIMLSFFCRIFEVKLYCLMPLKFRMEK